MNYTLIPSLEDISTSCIVFGVFTDTKLDEFSQIKDKEHQRLLPFLLNKVNEEGEWVWQAESNGTSLMLIHCGDAKTFDSHHLSKILCEVVSTLIKHRIAKVSLCLPQVSNKTPDWQLTKMILQIDSQCFQITDYKTKKKKIHPLETVEFYCPKGSESAIQSGICIAKGIRLTQHLAELPANHCTPTHLAEQAKNLEKEHINIKTKVLEAKELKEKGLRAILAVGQGSAEPPCLIELFYKGASNEEEAPVILVGKGITFDAGGISLKPAAAMDEMKYDMAGAASVLGTIKACALLKLPINVVGLIAAAENMPSGTALKPGDIISSYSGLTIEIMNTDAEGRLVLADALTYAQHFKPKFVIDIATLTGAMVVALGYVMTGFMTKDDQLASLISQASEESDDKAWRLPLDEAYSEAMESNIADMVNASYDRAAGSITAASFLSKFIENYPWAHLDIAGTAWVSGKNKHATGRPVPLLIQLLKNVANSN